MSTVARGIVKLYVTFTQQVILDEFLKSEGITEDEYNFIMSQKEPDRDDRYSDEEYDEIWDKWRNIEDRQIELSNNLIDFQRDIDLYDYLFYNNMSDEELKEFSDVLGNHLISAEMYEDGDGIQCMYKYATKEELEENKWECHIQLEFEIDSEVDIHYGYEGDPSIGQYRDVSDAEAVASFDDTRAIPELTDFFRKLKHTSGIQVTKISYSDRDTKWEYFYDDDDDGYDGPDTSWDY